MEQGRLGLFFLFVQAREPVLASGLLMCVAFTLFGPHSTLIAMGQSFLPGRVGLASGIMFGLTVSIGGLTAPGIGWIGDHYGLSTVMYLLGGLVVIALLLVFILPKEKLIAAKPNKQQDQLKK